MRLISLCTIASLALSEPLDARTVTPLPANPATDYKYDSDYPLPVEMERLPASTPTVIESYGPDALQYGEFRLPRGKGPFPVAVIVHGGCWTRGWATHRGFGALATALTEQGIATWNIEYRQLGDPGAGWPGTFQDWAAATDHLRDLAKRYPIDLKQTIVIGHSAGAHGALWIASRSKLPSTSEIRGVDPLPVSLVVAIDGPGDVNKFTDAGAGCDQSTIWKLFGGYPADKDLRYREGNPIQMLPSGVPTVLISSEVLLPEDAEHFRTVAAATGDKIELLELQDVGHFYMTDPARAPGKALVALIRQSMDLMKKP